MRTPTYFGLTERQILLLRLLAEGASNMQAAQHLGCSIFTVKNTYSHICERLELAGRTVLVLWAWRHALLSRRAWDWQAGAEYPRPLPYPDRVVPPRKRRRPRAWHAGWTEAVHACERWRRAHRSVA